jgi:YebC/PmpR family DNA-binding regulatory protein
MSGHSKWSTIKFKKGKADAQRGKIFTKIGREIAVAVKQGGSDPAANARLRDAIAKAKSNNMPNDNITRSIKKAAGELGAINYEEMVYEGYGAGGVAVIAEALTDNRNRTAGEVRHAFDKSGGSLGATGCVAWMFDRKGVLVIERTGETDEDELAMAAIDAGAEDFEADAEAFEITSAQDDFSAVREALEKAGYAFASAQIDMVPQNTVKPDAGTQENVLKLLDMLEDLDDVQNVYHNAELEEENE